MIYKILENLIDRFNDIETTCNRRIQVRIFISEFQ